MACRSRRTSTRCGGRPPFLANKDHRTAWVNTVALTIKRTLFGCGTVVSKLGGPSSVNPRTLQVEVFNRVCFIGIWRSLYDSCGSDPLVRTARA